MSKPLNLQQTVIVAETNWYLRKVISPEVKLLGKLDVDTEGKLSWWDIEDYIHVTKDFKIKPASEGSCVFNISHCNVFKSKESYTESVIEYIEMHVKDCLEKLNKLK